jgi:hypothetical protein
MRAEYFELRLCLDVLYFTVVHVGMMLYRLEV